MCHSVSDSGSEYESTLASQLMHQIYLHIHVHTCMWISENQINSLFWLLLKLNVGIQAQQQKTLENSCPETKKWWQTLKELNCVRVLSKVTQEGRILIQWNLNGSCCFACSERSTCIKLSPLSRSLLDPFCHWILWCGRICIATLGIFEPIAFPVDFIHVDSTSHFTSFHWMHCHQHYSNVFVADLSIRREHCSVDACAKEHSFDFTFVNFVTTKTVLREGQRERERVRNAIDEHNYWNRKKVHPWTWLLRVCTFGASPDICIWGSCPCVHKKEKCDVRTLHNHQLQRPTNSFLPNPQK